MGMGRERQQEQHDDSRESGRRSLRRAHEALLGFRIVRHSYYLHLAALSVPAALAAWMWWRTRGTPGENLALAYGFINFAYFLVICFCLYTHRRPGEKNAVLLSIVWSALSIAGAEALFSTAAGFHLYYVALFLILIFAPGTHAMLRLALLTLLYGLGLAMSAFARTDGPMLIWQVLYLAPFLRLTGMDLGEIYTANTIAVTLLLLGVGVLAVGGYRPYIQEMLWRMRRSVKASFQQNAEAKARLLSDQLLLLATGILTILLLSLVVFYPLLLFVGGERYVSYAIAYGIPLICYFATFYTLYCFRDQLPVTITLWAGVGLSSPLWISYLSLAIGRDSYAHLYFFVLMNATVFFLRVLPRSQTVLMVAIHAACFIGLLTYHNDYAPIFPLPFHPLIDWFFRGPIPLIILLAGMLTGLFFALETRFAEEELESAYSRIDREAERARMASQAKSLFLSTMSHEIRTPLNAIIGMADMLEESQLDERQREYTSTIARSGDHLLGLINDVLDFTRIESGEMEIHPETIDLRNLCEESLALFRSQCRQKNIQIEMQISRLVPEKVEIDPMRLRQILVNLIGNSVKFTPDGGQIHLQVQTGEISGTDRLQLHFLIEDQGIGIPADRVATVFEPFSQIPEAQKASSLKGTGLGLAIVKRIVDLMQGTIEIHSELSRGTRVHLSLEVGAPAESQVFQSATTGDQTFESQKPRQAELRILMVEDNPDNVRLFELYLARLDLKATVAVDGESALQLLAENEYDLILMDVQLPGIQGTDVVKHLRESPGPQPYVLGLTANAMEQDRAEYLRIGMDEVFAKPVRKADFADFIEKFRAGAIVRRSS